MKNILAVFIGGAIGTLLRYGVTLSTADIAFPLGTLLVNFVGSFLLGTFTGWIIQRKVNEYMKIGFGTGLCGGFTTMSTLAADVFLLEAQSTLLATTIYLFSSIVGGLLFAFLGLILGQFARRLV
ncbi:fluoride efflux transporter FluC [Bacillus sp. CHD6a]|uniref:fluoride efflux transporter FluC n=1 Tax=Bacillus sp. CHD6a TaxID=1643452 RepID=UPI0006CC4E5E|nr:CrcB family protein [Bacillus sp. CHD6a]KPB03143.1 chromosome condensation protein CrcB [Bacillus sp. CHD6a]